MDFVDIKNKGKDELIEMLAAKRDELRALKFKAKSSALKQVHKIAETRKTVAQICFLLSTKQDIKISK
ncbi:50S ribosomal protein L29 [Patescibacteria group bacterium]|nr:50S ribosomal protein L29 [Patescibacteria group bacterium]MBU1613336.1 50S ribosomal protein L29 [Patescibacteria group bacterium]